MSQKNSAQNVIQSYRKRQRMGPFVIGGLAVVLVVVGILVLVVWLTSSNKPALTFLASSTPTATETVTSTPVPPTATPTLTPTITLTPTLANTATRSAPIAYKVLEGDTPGSIATKFGIDVDVLLAANNLKAGDFIKVGDDLVIPAPGATLPTDTPVPTNFKGELSYVVKSGETLAMIANKFNSTTDAIIKRNKITDPDKINAGDTLIIPVNIITQTPTKKATDTQSPVSMTKTAIATANPPTQTPVPVVPSATKNP